MEAKEFVKSITKGAEKEVLDSEKAVKKYIKKHGFGTPENFIGRIKGKPVHTSTLSKMHGDDLLEARISFEIDGSTVLEKTGNAKIKFYYGFGKDPIYTVNLKYIPPNT